VLASLIVGGVLQLWFAIFSRRMLAKTKLRRALEGPAERVASGGGKVTNPMAAAGGQWPCWIPRIAVV
jgi:hypothetical protein